MDAQASDHQDRIRQKAYELWQAAGEPHGSPDPFWQQAEQSVGQDEADHDKTLDDSFPASDPPSSGQLA